MRFTLTLGVFMALGALGCTGTEPTPAGEGSPDVVINEVESSAGLSADWVEVYHRGDESADLSGISIEAETGGRAWTFPAGSVIGGRSVLQVTGDALAFDLTSSDRVQLRGTDGSVLDEASWTARAPSTLGRCPDGVGSIVTMHASPGRLNDCTSDAGTSDWPGDASVADAVAVDVVGEDLSGLAHEATPGSSDGVLWGVRNSPSSIVRFVADGTTWLSDTLGDWAGGRLLQYPDGGGEPDAEGVTLVPSALGPLLYVAAERDNQVSSTSRNSVLVFDPSATGGTLTAAREWDLTTDLPAVSANGGLEGITWIPDSVLVELGFLAETTGLPYEPTGYAAHGGGVVFLGLGSAGSVYAYVLEDTNAVATRVATIETGLAGVKALERDRPANGLWAVCDNRCAGQAVLLRIEPPGSEFAGSFRVTQTFDRPQAMSNLANEGFALGTGNCPNGRRAVFWADDGASGGVALRRGTMVCPSGR